MIRNANYIVLSLLMLFGANGCGRKPVNDKNPEGPGIISQGTPEITFTSLENDMGIIKEGEIIIRWLDFQNTGDGPLIIQNVKADCGCTVADWSGEPVNPGEKSSIKVIFDSGGKRGLQYLKVSVYSNAETEIQDLHLKGQVIKN